MNVHFNAAACAACAAVGALLLATPLASSSRPAAARSPLRVCADPNNLPFSNRRGEGFENRIAALLASDLHVNTAGTPRQPR